MPAPAELINLPHALTGMLVKQRADYERAVRAIRWGEPPFWAVGSAQSLPAAETLRFAFEDLLNWPVLVAEAASFAPGALSMLRPGSVVVIFSDGRAPAQDLARLAHKRGAQVLVVEATPASPDAEVAAPASVTAMPVTLALPAAGAAAEGGIGGACLQHAAAGQLALTCARQMTRPQARLERLESDWRDLPSHLDRLMSQLSDGVAALGGALASHSPVLLVGDAYYGAIVRRASAGVRQKTGRLAIGLDFADFSGTWVDVLTAESAVLIVCGSTGRAAKVSVELAGAVKARGCPLFVLTGSNHYDLVRQGRLGLILPEVADLPGSILALAVTGWIGSYLK